MIKTTVTLTCDRCGREIKAGDRYYVEEVDIFHWIWNGTEEVMIPGEEPEHRERDLCEECRKMLHDSVMEQAPIVTEMGIATADMDAGVTNWTTTSTSNAEPMIVKIPPEEPAVAEDVATGEAVELDGKTYTEYQLEPAPEAREAAEKIVAMAEKPRKKRSVITDAQKEQIIRMRESGASFGRIADTVDVSAQTAWNIYDKYKKEVQDGR